MKSVLKVSHCIEIPCDGRYYWLSCTAWTYGKSSYLVPNYRPNFAISLLFYVLFTAYFALRNTFYFFNYAVKYSLHQFVKFTNIILPTQPTLVQPSIGNREVSKQITRIIRIKWSFCFYKIRTSLYSANNSALFNNTHQLIHFPITFTLWHIPTSQCTLSTLNYYLPHATPNKTVFV
jgi:hypothetical protein